MGRHESGLPQKRSRILAPLFYAATFLAFRCDRFKRATIAVERSLLPDIAARATHDAVGYF